MKTYLPYFFVGLILFVFRTVSFSQDEEADHVQPASKTTIFEHLQQEPGDYLHIVLESDYKKLIQQKKEDEYQPATLTIRRSDGSEEKWQTDIKPRGNMRRSVCEIPPIKIRFDEEQLLERGLDKRSTLKMVILCRNGNGYEQLVLREYLAYKLYNLITDHSFQVQLAKVTYLDAGGKDRGFDESFAFFIEHPKDLADRTEASMLEHQRFGSRLMNTDAGERFAMFQYMIGNTDWYFFNNHNVEVCGIPGTSDLIPLPYDFDYAGLVKSPYAVPHDRIGTKTVLERYYQGYCRSEEETMETVQLFLSKKKEIMKMASTFPYFAKYSRKHVTQYLSKFFDILETPRKLKQEILWHCDKWPVR